MRFGTFFFFQAAPGLTHEEVVHRELDQMEWTEELGFDQIWPTEHHFIDIMLRAWTEERFSHEGRFFTVKDARVIPKPVQRPHPMIYQVCGSDSGVESTASRGWPMLNSILTGPVDQILKRRDSYLEALRRHGRGETEIAGLMKNWGVSRQIYVAPTDAQALAEAKDAEMWYQDSLPQDKIRRSMELFAREVMPRFRA